VCWWFSVDTPPKQVTNELESSTNSFYLNTWHSVIIRKPLRTMHPYSLNNNPKTNQITNYFTRTYAFVQKTCASFTQRGSRGGNKFIRQTIELSKSNFCHSIVLLQLIVYPNTPCVQPFLSSVLRLTVSSLILIVIASDSEINFNLYNG
jgi:hypothetical protein